VTAGDFTGATRAPGTRPSTPARRHQRVDTSASTPARRHQRVDTSASTPARRHQRVDTSANRRPRGKRGVKPNQWRCQMAAPATARENSAEPLHSLRQRRTLSTLLHRRARPQVRPGVWLSARHGTAGGPTLGRSGGHRPAEFDLLRVDLCGTRGPVSARIVRGRPRLSRPVDSPRADRGGDDSGDHRGKAASAEASRAGGKDLGKTGEVWCRYWNPRSVVFSPRRRRTPRIKPTRVLSTARPPTSWRS
jgi:hypothetical protein